MLWVEITSQILIYIYIYILFFNILIIRHMAKRVYKKLKKLKKKKKKVYQEKMPI